MELDIEFGVYLCYTRTFIINGIKADSDDFGEQEDREPENGGDYGCGDMRFSRIQPEPEVLSKYNITKSEYLIISGLLENGLSFGSCGLCE